jgi:hypothetical protein
VVRVFDQFLSVVVKKKKKKQKKKLLKDRERQGFAQRDRDREAVGGSGETGICTGREGKMGGQTGPTTDNADFMDDLDYTTSQPHASPSVSVKVPFFLSLFEFYPTLEAERNSGLYPEENPSGTAPLGNGGGVAMVFLITRRRGATQSHLPADMALFFFLSFVYFTVCCLRACGFCEICWNSKQAVGTLSSSLPHQPASRSSSQEARCLVCREA